MFYYNYKKVFQFRKICFFIRESIRNFFSFALVFEKFFLNKKCEKKYKKFLI